MIEIPAVVREKALTIGASAWIDGLPLLIQTIEAEWGITVGRAYRGASSCLASVQECHPTSAPTDDLCAPAESLR